MMLRPLPVAVDGVHEGDEDRQAQQAVDDRRHARQVADVDLDEAREPRVARVLLEVDRGRQAEREGDEGHDHGQDRRPDDALPDAGLGRVGRQRRWSGSPRPRSAKTGIALLEDVDHEDEQDGEREQEAPEQQDLEDGAGVTSSRRR